MQYLHLLVNALPKRFYFPKAVALCTILSISTSCNFFTEDNPIANKERPRIELDFDYDAFTITKLEEAGVYSGVAEEGIAALSRLEKRALEKVSDLMSMNDLENQSEAYHKEILKNFEVIEDDRSKLLQSILKKLVKTIDANGVDHPEWKVFLVKPKGFSMLNYFTSGSHLYCTTEMFSFLDGNKDMLALITGHELFHTLNHDVSHHYSRKSLTIKHLGENFGNKVYNLYETAMSSVAQSREGLCDIQAINVMYHSGFDPYTGIIAYYRLCNVSEANEGLSRLLSSHQYIYQRMGALCLTLEKARIRAEEKNKLSFPN